MSLSAKITSLEKKEYLGSKSSLNVKFPFQKMVLYDVIKSLKNDFDQSSKY